MKILLIDNGTTLLQKLQVLLGSHEITKKWNEVEISDATSYDLIILSGSSAYSIAQNHDQFKNEIELIRSALVPIIGICFGCELVAYAFGGTIGGMKSAHHGIRDIEFTSPGFSSKPAVKVYENHSAIISKVPEEFEVIAVSTDGPEAIRHKSRPIYGLQFHPENFVNETEGDEIFMRIVNSLASKS